MERTVTQCLFETVDITRFTPTEMDAYQRLLFA